MSKFFILKIESLIQTFTVVDSGKIITFNYSAQDTQQPFGEIQEGDMILGYYGNPMGVIKVVFEVEKIITDEEIELVKRMEMEQGFTLKDKDLLEKLSKEDLVFISKKLFYDIYDSLLDMQKIEKTDEFDYLFELENKEFAVETIKILRDNDCFTAEVLSILLSKEKSSSILKNWFPILVEITTLDQKDALIRDENGRNRYYPEEIIINENRYVITNNWYYGGQKDRDTRTPFVEWIKSLIKKHSQSESGKFYFDDIIFSAPKIPIAYNYLVFGAPGTGKSHEVKKLQEEYFSDTNSFERITFYSNYSYSNFVGTYKPKMDGRDITYTFVPGPFIRILEKAYKNPNKNFLLLIEEINRANAAAVFGDVFQLLDRKAGRSEYSIETNEDLKLYFAEKFIEKFSEIADIREKTQILNYFSKIYIPSNMYIWSTMNSADQGVFPMDTAFKRRWDFRYIGVDENSDSIKNVIFSITNSRNEIKNVNWNKLRIKLNEILSGPQCKVNEDKLLGPYFISGELMAIDKETNQFNKGEFDNSKFLDAFKNKVIMYLFEDAAKQKRTEIFKGCDDVSRFSSICNEFNKIGVSIFGDDIETNVVEM